MADYDRQRQADRSFREAEPIEYVTGISRYVISRLVMAGVPVEAIDARELGELLARGYDVARRQAQHGDPLGPPSGLAFRGAVEVLIERAVQQVLGEDRHRDVGYLLPPAALKNLRLEVAICPLWPFC